MKRSRRSHANLKSSIRMGNLKTVKYLVEVQRCKINQDLLDLATFTGNLPLIKYLDEGLPNWWYEKYERDMRQFVLVDFNIVSKYGFLHIFQHYYDSCSKQQKKERIWFINDDCMEIASANNHFEIVKFLHEKGVSFNDDSFHHAVINRNITYLKYLAKHNYEIEEDIDSNLDAFYEILPTRYDMSKGIKPNVELIRIAFHHFRLNDFFKMVVDPDINYSLIEIASRYNYIDLLKHQVEIEHDIPGSHIMDYALENDNLEIVKYLEICDCDIRKDPYQYAAFFNSINVYKYLRRDFENDTINEIQCELLREDLYDAIEGGAMNVFEYILSIIDFGLFNENYDEYGQDSDSFYLLHTAYDKKDEKMYKRIARTFYETQKEFNSFDVEIELYFFTLWDYEDENEQEIRWLCQEFKGMDWITNSFFWNSPNYNYQNVYPALSPRTRAIMSVHSLMNMWREKVKWMIKVRPYAWHWYGEYQQAICAPNRIGRIQDRLDFQAEFI